MAIMSDTKLICFDLDDTLIREIHSVMYLGVLNNRLEETIEIKKREENGEITWIEADHHYAELACGLKIEKVSTEFNNLLKPIKNILNVITTLHKSGFKCILITAGPKQVAEFACKIWKLDGCYGSDYEIADRKFTGRIINHIGDQGKIACLQEYCNKYEINPNNCIAIGDGVSDIPLFEYCGCSIAINYSDAVIGKATHYIKTDDLSDILNFVIK